MNIYLVSLFIGNMHFFMVQNILDVSIVREVSNVSNVRILPEQPLIELESRYSQ